MISNITVLITDKNENLSILKATLRNTVEAKGIKHQFDNLNAFITRQGGTQIDNIDKYISYLAS